MKDGVFIAFPNCLLAERRLTQFSAIGHAASGTNNRGPSPIILLNKKLGCMWWNEVVLHETQDVTKLRMRAGDQPKSFFS